MNEAYGRKVKGERLVRMNNEFKIKASFDGNE